ncbi:hypothetical protein [Mycolicibacterium phlei]|uniref:hypothetical protein n=1 Tax=Mycolicibacterium phlei TaxID=1771 RepID=UPI00103DED3A|nr:hypothetical protein [Mycolicibacterium phlei]
MNLKKTVMAAGVAALLFAGATLPTTPADQTSATGLCDFIGGIPILGRIGACATRPSQPGAETPPAPGTPTTVRIPRMTLGEDQ